MLDPARILQHQPRNGVEVGAEQSLVERRPQQPDDVVEQGHRAVDVPGGQKKRGVMAVALQGGQGQAHVVGHAVIEGQADDG